MDEKQARELIAEWAERGRHIEVFVTATISPKYVPITLFEHLPGAADKVAR